MKILKPVDYSEDEDYQEAKERLDADRCLL